MFYGWPSCLRVIMKSPGRSFFLFASFLLVIAVLFSFPSHPTLGNNSNNTVNVNAQIQPTQALKVEGQAPHGSRSKALIPVKLSEAEKQESGKFVSTGKFTLNLGSNTEWELFARIANLEETRNSLRDSGWKLEGFILGLGREKNRMRETHDKIASGSYGEHELEASFKVTISKRNSPPNGAPPPLAELENVIFFALR